VLAHQELGLQELQEQEPLGQLELQESSEQPLGLQADLMQRLPHLD
jgi:hypothetical protein